jgi:hypothetical protein
MGFYERRSVPVIFYEIYERRSIPFFFISVF